MTMTKDDAVKRLRGVIAAWGAEPAGWPAAERPLLDIPGVRDALAPELAEAARLDALLRDLPEPPPLPDRVEDAVIAAGLAAARNRRERSPIAAALDALKALWPDDLGGADFARGAAAAAVAVTVGAGLGQMTPAEAPPEDQFYAIAAADTLSGFGGEWGADGVLQ